MLKKILTFFVCGLTLFTTPLLAWDNAGHELIAIIAYDRLHENTKQEVDYYARIMDKRYTALLRFLRASTWADYIRAQDVTAYNSWHYINIPYSLDRTATKPPQLQNAAWAINQAQQVLYSQRSNSFQKAEFLRFLLHFVGDIHQPMHAVNAYSKSHPYGDEGGNLYYLDEENRNLHSYWDGGAGLLKEHLSIAELKELARKITQDYPPEYFKNIQDDNPQDWANESFQIAKDFAYQTPQGKKPSAAYQAKGQQYVEQRIALAGYRLANMLNTIYTRSE